MRQSFNKIKTSAEVQQKLTILKASNRTKLTPNLILRIAFCHSLNIPSPPKPEDYDQEGSEFNRYTLTGEYDSLFSALLKQRLVEDGLDPEADFVEYFRGHLNRGVLEIYSRFKKIEDISLFFDRDIQKQIKEIVINDD